MFSVSYICRYLLYVIINIIFFSFISISIYELLCIQIEYSVSDTPLLVSSIYNNSYYSDLNASLCFSTIMSQYTCVLLYNIYELFSIFHYNIYLLYSLEFKTYDVYIDLSHYSYFYIFQLRILTKIASDTFLFEYVGFKLSFQCLHDLISIIPYETSLVFFRLQNYSSLHIDCISMYVVYPIEYSYILIKLQCFCFSSMLIHPFELVELPVIFFFECNIHELLIRRLYFFYIVMPYYT